MSTKTIDRGLLVVGGTPGGIAAAVRAARAGLDAELVTYNAHLGGMMAGGLSFTDTFIREPRAPLFEEFREAVLDHYRTEYGADSPQFEAAQDPLCFEPTVAESIFDSMVESEDDLSVTWEHRPVSAERSGGKLVAATFEPFDDDGERLVRADAFVDATYEGDLYAAAGTDYRVGREPRQAFDEPHAGRIFSEKGTRIFPGSTGAGDDAVQSYDYRLCLSRDPDNRRYPETPEGYDREEFLPIVADDSEEAGRYDAVDVVATKEECYLKSEVVRPTIEEIRERGLASILLLRDLPNEKGDLNTADLPGEADDYPEGDWETRERITTRHERHVLGMLYFLQNDEAVPEDIRSEAREWGLAADEFTDNDNVPFQLYVREARRLVGRETFTENDARIAEGLDRAPINDGAVAIAEYPMDSHDVRPVRYPDSLCDGHVFLGEITVPSQVPWGTFLPEGLDNLLVPVALSATHVGFGTIRLEPTWMQLGETAGLAAALAAERDVLPGELDAEAVQRELLELGSTIAYFEDFHVETDEPWVEPIQYLGTKGFFRGYTADPEAPLGPGTATVWADATADLLAGDLDAGAVARDLPEDPDGSVAAGAFVSLLEDAIDDPGIDTEGINVREEREAVGIEDGPITRGAASRLVYRIVR